MSISLTRVVEIALILTVVPFMGAMAGSVWMALEKRRPPDGGMPKARTGPVKRFKKELGRTKRKDAA